MQRTISRWVRSRQLHGEKDQSLVGEVVEDGLRSVAVVWFIIPYEYIVDRGHESGGIELDGLTWSIFPG